MIKKTFVLFFMALVIVSCSPPLRVSYFPGARVYPHTAPAAIDLLRNEPLRPHVAFAVIRYDPPPGMSRKDVEWQLREQAADIGADALVIEVDTVFREKVWAGPYRPLVGRRVHRAVVRDNVIEAVAIRYR